MDYHVTIKKDEAVSRHDMTGTGDHIMKWIMASTEKKKDKNLTVSYMWSLVKDDLGELQRKSTMALTRNQGVKVTGKDDKDLVIGAKLDTDGKKNSGFVLHGEVTVFNIL